MSKTLINIIIKYTDLIPEVANIIQDYTTSSLSEIFSKYYTYNNYKNAFNIALNININNDIFQYGNYYLIYLTDDNIEYIVNELCNNEKYKNVVLYGPITYINNYFLCKNINIQNLELNFPELRKVGNDFLYQTYGLTSLICNLPKLQIIGDNMLYDSYKLINVEFNLPLLRIIKKDWLNECSMLSNLKLNLPELHTIGKNFLKNCNNLENLKLNSPKLINIDIEGLIENCNNLSITSLTNIHAIISNKKINYKNIIE